MVGDLMMSRSIAYFLSPQPFTNHGYAIDILENTYKGKTPIHNRLSCMQLSFNVVLLRSAYC